MNRGGIEGGQRSNLGEAKVEEVVLDVQVVPDGPWAVPQGLRAGRGLRLETLVGRKAGLRP